MRGSLGHEPQCGNNKSGIKYRLILTRLNGCRGFHYHPHVLSLTARVEQVIERRTLLRPGDRVVVAVSGGLDSMVLLRVLHSLAQSRSWHLVVAHFDHQLRGLASRADARLVGRTALELELEFIQECGDVKGYARETHLSVEMAARILRHRFLARAAREVKASAVALAHHADDQVELFFLRTFRGAGVEGLAGMNWKGVSPEDRRIRLIRPLLDERRTDLARFARNQRIEFREDSSNRSLDIGRNRIRHSLLPMLRRQYQAALDNVILRTMATMRDTAAFLDQQAVAWRSARRKPPFPRLPTALQRQILSLQLRELKVPPSFDLLERLRLSQGERISFGVGQFLSRDQQGTLIRTTGIAFCAEESALSLEGRGGKSSFGGLDLAWRLVGLRTGVLHRGGRRQKSECFDADKVGASIVLRHWRPGDRFQPIGLPRPAKLQDLFVNLRIPRAIRHHLVLATTAAGEIFWVEGLRIAEGFKLDKCSRRGLKWTSRRTEGFAKGLVAPCPSPW